MRGFLLVLMCWRVPILPRMTTILSPIAGHLVARPGA
jgi:hypothetical protein